MSGWVKLHRQFIKWEWFTDVNTCHLFTYLLLEANHKETKWRGHIIMPGQLLTGRIKMAQETGLSERNVRTSLDKLKSTKEVTSKSYNKYSIITVTNWDKYQQIDQQPTSGLTSNRPATDQQPTTSNNEKNINNGKKLINIGDFEEFWNIYGFKVGRDKAITSYNKIIKSGVSHDEITRGVIKYQQHCQATGVSGKYVKQPTTWLNGGHWKDEYPEYIGEQRKQSADDNITAGLILALRDHAEQQGY